MRRKHTVLMALAASVFLHMFVWSQVTFIFRGMPESFKPTLTSLGSILQSEDVHLPVKTHKMHTRENASKEIPFLSQEHRAEDNIIADVQKAPFSTFIRKGQRTYDKFNFLDDDISDSQAKQRLRDFGIDPDIPGRVPLRINY